MDNSVPASYLQSTILNNPPSCQISAPMSPQPQQTSLSQGVFQPFCNHFATILQNKQTIIQQQNDSVVKPVSPAALISPQPNTSFPTPAHVSMIQPSIKLPTNSINDASLNNLTTINNSTNESGMNYNCAEK